MNPFIMTAEHDGWLFVYVSSEIPALYMKNKCLYFSCFCDIPQVTCQGGTDIDIFALNITVCVKHQLSCYPLRSVVINHKPRVQSHRQQRERWQSLSWLQIVQPLRALIYHINLLICWKGLMLFLLPVCLYFFLFFLRTSEKVMFQKSIFYGTIWFISFLKKKKRG